MSLKWYAFLLAIYVVFLVFFTLPTLGITLGLLLLAIVWLAYAAIETVIILTMSAIINVIVGIFTWSLRMVK